jgi:cysteine desulfurase / selenocysteine lyase
MIDWNKYYTEYPVNQELIWLNNCGTTPVGNSIKAAVNHYLDGYSRHGVFTDTNAFSVVRRNIVSALCKLLNSESDELAIIHHTSEGMNFISQGLSLENGDEVILMENEYPSNVYPWQHLKSCGANLKFVAVGDTPEQFLENLNSSLTTKTKVISISAVHWCTGMPLPIEEIGLLCEERGIIFVLDGAQGVGHVPIDVKKMKIDYMAFSAWKWLLGPLGLGVLYVNRANLSKVKTIFVGQSSVVNPEEYLPYKSVLLPGADRFEYSTPNFTDWVYFEASLKMLGTIGFSAVKERIYELSSYLAKGLVAMGYKVNTEQFSQKTGIIVCESEKQSSLELQKHLKANKVISAVRLDKLRLAPHIYNSKEQLDTVLNLLK